MAGVHPVGLDVAPEPREAHCVAEGVYYNNRKETPCSDEYKGRICSKKGRVRQLQQRATNGGEDGHVRMGQTEFVEVMDVSEAEYDRRQVDDAAKRHTGSDKEGDGGGPKEKFLGHRALRNTYER